MTHIRLDDGFGEHPKVARLSHLAYRLFVNGLGYCSRRQTDGFIPAAVIPTLAVDGPRRITTAMAELEDAGLWHPRADGYDVHDYLKHQRSKVQIEEQQQKGRERWQRFTKRPTNGVANGVANGPLTENRVVSEGRGQRAEIKSKERAAVEPRASATSMPPLRLEDATRAYQAWDKQAPMGMNPAIKEKLDAELESGTPVEFIEKACQIAGEAGGRKPWNYVNSILSRLKAGKPDKKPAENTMGIYRLPKKASNS